MSDDPSSLFDRTPPASNEAEVGVLCAMMIDRAALAEATEYVGPDDFYYERHRRVFRAIVAVFDRGDTVDVVTVIERLRESGELESAGGIDYLAGLVDATPTSAHVASHARIVREKAALRRVVEVASTAIRDVYDLGDRTASDVVARAEDALVEIGAGRGSDAVRIKDRLWPVFTDLERRQAGESSVGLLTGLADLDKKILGLHAGELIVVGARPSMGKTSLGTKLALEASVGAAVPTAFFSFEMTADELTLRALAVEGRLDLLGLRGGSVLNEEETQRMATAAGHLNTAPLWIDDSAGEHVGEVTAKIRRLRHTENVGLVVVDYLQLMTGTGDGRREQIDSITRGLKKVAKALGIPVVLLSQLSRGPESRTNKRPMMSDLRESGGVEQDADVVLLLYRPEYYMSADAIEKKPSVRGLAEIIVAKQRNGPTGTVSVRFDKPTTRFENLARSGGPQPLSSEAF